MFALMALVVVAVVGTAVAIVHACCEKESDFFSVK